jgi:hypothetical protein
VLVGAGVAAHVAGTVAIVLYHTVIYRGGDMLTYHALGTGIAHIIARDSGYLTDLVRLTLHQDNGLALEIVGFEGTSSGSMCAIAAWLALAFGDTLFGPCLGVSIFAFVGQLAMFRAVSHWLRPAERRPVLAAFMLLPSVVFWTSGLVKEAFVAGFLGLISHGMVLLLRRRAVVVPLFELAAGLLGVGILKPYTLFPFVLGVGGWVFAARRRGGGVGYRVLGIVVALVGIFAVSRAFPEFGVDRLGATVMHQQQSYTTEAGSTVAIGDADELEENASLSKQLKYFPLAVVNSLARPVLFEARNPSQLLGSLEMTIVLVLLLVTLQRAGARALLREIMGAPPLLFAFVFVATFSVAVGLSTGNLGTLSRYRVPAMPLYVGLLLVLRVRFAPKLRRRVSSRARRPASVATLARPGVPPGSP